jgi:hypothetical protein
MVLRARLPVVTFPVGFDSPTIDTRREYRAPPVNVVARCGSVPVVSRRAWGSTTLCGPSSASLCWITTELKGSGLPSPAPAESDGTAATGNRLRLGLLVPLLLAVSLLARSVAVAPLWLNWLRDGSAIDPPGTRAVVAAAASVARAAACPGSLSTV